MAKADDKNEIVDDIAKVDDIFCKVDDKHKSHFLGSPFSGIKGGLRALVLKFFLQNTLKLNNTGGN
jgi:hypothetical protein